MTRPRNTRKRRAFRLLRILEHGPTSIQNDADVALWLRHFVIDEVKALIPELVAIEKQKEAKA